MSSRARRHRSQQAVAQGGGFQRQFTFWLAALVLVVLALWLLSEILLPFIAGAAIAYLLTPLTDRLERFGITRLAAAFLIITLVVMAIVLVILLVAPILGGQLSSFIEKLPDYVSRLQSLLNDQSRPWVQKLLGAGLNTDKTFTDLVTQGAPYDQHYGRVDSTAPTQHRAAPGARGAGWLTAFLKSLWSGGRALVSVFSLIVVTPVVAFYLIYDWLCRGADDRWAQFRAADRTALGPNHLHPLCWLDDRPRAGARRGGGTVRAGLGRDLTVLGIFLVGQFCEGNLLSPKLVGESVGLHPLWLIFALLAFGYLFGFVGLLVAVPLAATIGVLARFALRRYLESSLYTGGAD